MTAALHVIRDDTPFEPAVRCLETLLERAKAGELRAVVVVFETKEHTGHAFAWGRETNPMGLVGELHLAQFSVLCDAGRVTPPT